MCILLVYISVTELELLCFSKLITFLKLERPSLTGSSVAAS
jgi:hypothetical protein